MAEPKKFSCLDCGKDVDLSKEDGVCESCGLNNGAVIERARHNKALKKYEENAARESGDDKDKGKKKSRFAFGG